MNEVESMQWYAQLEKPFFAPPAWLFGPVWSVLYVLIAISFGYGFYKIYKKELPTSLLAPLIINIISNAAFSPIQFTLKNNALALVDVLIVWISIIWIIRSAWNKERWVAYLQIPYLMWVTFASILQASITWLNW